MIKLYKYLSINDPACWQYRKSLIANRTLYFNDPVNFNDPLDCNIASWNKAKDRLYNCRIFCLSTENRNDNLMFAHYADGHKGFRLKFNVDVDLPIADCSVLALGRAVIYKENIPHYSSEKAHEFYYLKSTSWLYESEYRILLKKGESHKFNEDELSEIALGARFNMDFLPVLKEWASEGKHKNIVFTKAVPSEDKLSFDYVPIYA